MRRALIAISLCVLLLAASVTPAFAHGRQTHQAHHAHHSMCIRSVEGACNPGVGSPNQQPPQWECHPIMGPAAPGHVRSSAWICGWV